MTVCPLCGGAPVAAIDDLLACTSCAELLRPSEVVSKANQSTFRAYCLANFGTPDYPDHPEHKRPRRRLTMKRRLR